MKIEAILSHPKLDIVSGVRFVFSAKHSELVFTSLVLSNTIVFIATSISPSAMYPKSWRGVKVSNEDLVILDNFQCLL